MGRIGISGGGIGGVTSYTLLDDLSFKGVGTRGLGGGTGNFFSIDFGTTLLKEFNGVASGDTRDWASGTLDSFNAFSSSGVANPLTAIDFRVMDVLGYDKIAVVSGTPEPGTLALFAIALSGLAWRRRKQ